MEFRIQKDFRRICICLQNFFFLAEYTFRGGLKVPCAYQGVLIRNWLVEIILKDFFTLFRNLKNFFLSTNCIHYVLRWIVFLGPLFGSASSSLPQITTVPRLPNIVFISFFRVSATCIGGRQILRNSYGWLYLVVGVRCPGQRHCRRRGSGWFQQNCQK